MMMSPYIVSGKITTGFHTQAESRNFVRDGFVVLKGLRDGRETAETHALVESAWRLPRELACTRPHDTLLPPIWNDRAKSSTVWM
jgi:hypothetical protein